MEAEPKQNAKFVNTQKSCSGIVFDKFERLRPNFSLSLRFFFIEYRTKYTHFQIRNWEKSAHRSGMSYIPLFGRLELIESPHENTDKLSSSLLY